METFYSCRRSEWRDYLSRNFRTASEVWFVFPMKSSGEKSLSYNDAVEEALCFGWIDSINKYLDGQHCIRRFSPRNRGVPYSQPNIERLILLESQGLIHPDVRKDVLPVIQTPFVFPPDIIDALMRDKDVWGNYLGFSEPYRRIRIAYIEAARRRPEEFAKRLENFIEKTRTGKKIIGYGGIDKYYG